MRKPLLYGLAGVGVLIVGTVAVWQLHSHGALAAIIPPAKTVTINGKTYETMASFAHDAKVQLTGKPDSDLIYFYDSYNETYSFSTIKLTKADPINCNPPNDAVGGFKVVDKAAIGTLQNFYLSQQRLDSLVSQGQAQEIKNSYLMYQASNTWNTCGANPKTEALFNSIMKQDPVLQLLHLIKSGS